MTLGLVVWDWDGVLNRFPGSGPADWAPDAEREFGVSAESFRAFLRRPGQQQAAFRGQIDIVAELDAWLRGEGADVSGADFHAYWLDREHAPDDEIVSLLASCRHRSIIGTNSVAPRGDRIIADPGIAPHVEHVVASGAVGAAKPDPGFFAAIERWSGLPPSAHLLIDDRAANCAAAAKRGWRSFRFAPERRDRLAELLS